MRRLWKKGLSAVLTLSMVLGLMPTMAFAAERMCTCEPWYANGEFIEVEFDGSDTALTVPDNSEDCKVYYLSKDVILTDDITNNGKSDGTTGGILFCLNGHTLYLNGYEFKDIKGHFSIMDCKGGGKIVDDKTLTIVWEDNSDPIGLRPEPGEVTVYYDDGDSVYNEGTDTQVYGTYSFAEDQSDSNKWTYTVQDMEIYTKQSDSGAFDKQSFTVWMDGLTELGYTPRYTQSDFVWAIQHEEATKAYVALEVEINEDAKTVLEGYSEPVEILITLEANEETVLTQTFELG